MGMLLSLIGVKLYDPCCHPNPATAHAQTLPYSAWELPVQRRHNSAAFELFEVVALLAHRYAYVRWKQPKAQPAEAATPTQSSAEGQQTETEMLLVVERS